MNKITAVVIEGKCYNVASLTVLTLQEYVRDVNTISDVGAVNTKYAKYGVKKVK